VIGKRIKRGLGLGAQRKGAEETPMPRRRTPSAGDKAVRVRRLLAYITAPEASGDREGLEKCTHWAACGFALGDTIDDHINEMTHLAQSKLAGSDPVEHLVFSWPPGEQPTRDQVDEAALIALQTLGFVGHQAVWALHEDRAQIHVHLAFNRVNPVTERFQKAEWLVDRIHQAVARIEHAQGWRSQEGARYELVGDTPVLRAAPKTTPELSQGARAFERQTAMASAQRLAQERAPSLSSAKSWRDAHAAFQSAGLEYRRVGSGAVIVVGAEAVKASSVNRRFSFSQLERQFGSYEPSSAGGHRGPPHAQGRVPDVPLVPPELRPDWEVFHAARRKAFDDARSAKDAAIKRRTADREELRRRQKEERDDALAGSWKGAGLALNALRRALGEKHRAEAKLLAERHKAAALPPPVVYPDFPEWLVRLGRADDAEKARSAIASRPVVHAEPQPEAAPPVSGQTPTSAAPQRAAFASYSQAVAADVYKITIIRDMPGRKGPGFMFTAKIGFPDGAPVDVVLANIGELQRLESRGENIFVTPCSASTFHILVDDLTAEKLASFKAAGFRPAAVIESSRGNFQAVLNVPRGDADDEIERAVANSLTKDLNLTYGDPNLSGAVHAHRFPAFKNQKLKYAPDYPTTRLVEAAGGVCGKLECLAARKRAEIIADKERSAKNIAAAIGVNAAQTSATAQLVRVYAAHAGHIAACRGADGQDASRLDYMIAIRMRATGHSREAVMAAIASASPEIAERKRNVGDYVRRTADAAFGASGQRDVEKYGRWIPSWRNLEAATNPAPASKTPKARAGPER